MEASERIVCHKTIDPVAGLVQDYWRFEEKGVYGKRKGGWFADMFGPGFEGEDLPATDRWRSLQWLGEHTAKDPRFAVAMVEHVYYISPAARCYCRRRISTTRCIPHGCGPIRSSAD